LYNKGPSCKENNLKCPDNKYNDLRRSAHF